jgi:hypothetical protein
VNRGALVGSAKIELPSGVIISDVNVMDGAGGPWAAMPRRAQIDRNGMALRDADGRIRYAPIIEFASRESAIGSRVRRSRLCGWRTRRRCHDVRARNCERAEPACRTITPCESSSDSSSDDGYSRTTMDSQAIMSNTQRPKYCAINDWCDLSGMRRSSVYLALTRGDLRAIKLGKRTLIDAEHGLAWLAGRPLADIRTGQKTAA